MKFNIGKNCHRIICDFDIRYSIFGNLRFSV
jgi:hypothetical protein